MTSHQPLAIILFAHGSRDPLWRRPVEAVAERIARSTPGALVACAYLELCLPDLPSCARQLIEQGAGALRIVPLFLGVGRHAREDLPRLVEEIRSRHAGVAVELRPAIGEHPALLDLMAQLATEAAG